jgi:hypothetical protein
MTKSDSEVVATVEKGIKNMTKEEAEAIFTRAVHRAQQELHANGQPYIIGDTQGTYAVYPDGRRSFKPYRNKE